MSGKDLSLENGIMKEVERKIKAANKQILGLYHLNFIMGISKPKMRKPKINTIKDRCKLKSLHYTHSKHSLFIFLTF